MLHVITSYSDLFMYYQKGQFHCLILSQAPITTGCLASAHKLRFFDTSGKNITKRGWWTDIPNLAPLPRRFRSADINSSDLIVSDETLFASACYQNCMYVMYRYRQVENYWEEICHVQSIQLHVVYLNAYFYFVNFTRGTVHRYNIENKQWDTVQSLPRPFHDYVILTTFMGKLVVYGQVAGRGTHKVRPRDIVDHMFELHVYDLEHSRWTGVLCDRLPRDCIHGNGTHSKPVIVQHNGTCYRVYFKMHLKTYSEGVIQTELPVVHELKFAQSDEGAVLVEIGEEQCQEFIPANRFGVFQIEDDVFVSNGGTFVLKTGLKTWEDQWENGVDFQRLERLRKYAGSSVVLFTFNSQVAKS